MTAAAAPAVSSSRLSLETRIWISAGSASIGDGLRLAALPLAIAAITRDPIQVAGLTVAQRVPGLLFALPAGVILDRVDSFRVLAACQWIRMGLMLLLAGAMGMLGVMHSGLVLPAIYALAALLASMEVFGDVAAQVAVQLLVSDDRLEHTNSRVVAGQMLGEEFLGPPAGGLLFGLGRWPAFLGAGLAYAVSALLLKARPRVSAGEGVVDSSLPAPAPGSASLSKAGADVDRSRPAGVFTGIAAEAGRGLAIVFSNRDLLVQAVWTSAMNAANGLVGAVFVLFALQDLHLSGAAYGALLTAGGIGGVFGATVVGVVARRVPRVVLMVSTSLLASLCTLALGVAPDFAAVFTLQCVAAFCGVIFSVVARSFRQSITPPAFAGRTTSVYRLLSLGAVPLGALGGGVLASTQGPGGAIVVAGAIMLVSTLGATPFLRRKSNDPTPMPPG